jgi:hypothetical protein
MQDTNQNLAPATPATQKWPANPDRLSQLEEENKQLRTRLGQTGEAGIAPEPKLFKVSIAAQTASDANGRSYNTYCIIDPLRFWERRMAIRQLQITPREQIGASDTVTPPTYPKGNVVVLERGGEPIDLIVTKEQLDQLKGDRKNLNIFAISAVDSKTQLGTIKSNEEIAAAQKKEADAKAAEDKANADAKAASDKVASDAKARK